MPFRYRLQKILDFRIRKKEEQLQVVQKAQQAVFEAEENIRKNNEEIRDTQINMRQANPMMYETYDKYLIYLWEKAEQLEQIRQEAQRRLDIEKQKLIKLEQGVKVLEKHKEKNREAYIAEEKAAELKQFSELGVTRFFAQSKEKQEEEEKEVLRQLAQLEENL
ncbi:unknown [Brachyspira sp. CAG:484]|nr:unknown [Brachyspira sp. CAG:484]